MGIEFQVNNETTVSQAYPDVVVLSDDSFVVTWHSFYQGVRSQSEAYAKKLEGAGVFVNKTVLPGQTHNTVLCRKVLSGGKDPALVAGALLRKAIEGKDHASR